MQSRGPASRRDHTRVSKIVGLCRLVGLHTQPGPKQNIPKDTVKLGMNESCGHSLSHTLSRSRGSRDPHNGLSWAFPSVGALFSFTTTLYPSTVW